MPKNLEQPIDDEKINYYTKEQLIHFLKCLENEKNFKAFALFRLLAFSGILKGEALALTWNDLNFKNVEIRINKALSRGEDNRLYLKKRLKIKALLVLLKWIRLRWKYYMSGKSSKSKTI